jgi:hypothetical protein
MCALCAAAADAAPTVLLSEWKNASGTGVRFEALTPLVVPPDPTAPLDMQDEVAGGAFQYAIDTTGINWNTDCTCFRYYGILVRARATGQVTRHKFRAIPSGSFEDQYAEVNMTITEGATSGELRVRLPVSSAPGLEPKPLTVSRPEPGPDAVSLGGETRIRLTLENSLKEMPVAIPTAVVVQPRVTDLWGQAEAQLPRRDGQGEGSPLVLKPGARETLTLVVRPQTLRAVETSLVPIEGDKAHSHLDLEIPYANPLFGNREGIARADVPVRFRPGVLTLLAALLIGVLLGSVIPLLAPKRGTLGLWGKATATGAAVGIILWFVGIFLVANNSKFVLFSFNLDPWQTLPTLLLGIGNGLGGFKAAEWLKFIPKKSDD